MKYFCTLSAKGREACVFYPIHPSLDIHTSPAVRDPACAEFQLKSSITRLQHENPDGVLPCQYFPLNCFQDGRQAFIYCGPEWGMDYEKVITGLSTCHRLVGYHFSEILKYFSSWLKSGTSMSFFLYMY